MTGGQFLQDLYATSTRTARRVEVITDNAKYHHARWHQDWRQQRAKRLALDFPPPYRPDWNPAERVWKLTRRLGLRNRYFPRLDEVARAFETQFANRNKPHNTLRRLCTVP